MEEIWKPIEGYEGVYEVSNMGNIKALHRTVIRCDGVKMPVCKNAHITPRINKDGYLVVRLSKDGKRKQYFVHRLVAQSFIENNNNLPEVNHIDIDRTNNCVNNLEWCTHKENVQYAIDLGNHYCTKDLTGANNPNYHNKTLKEKYHNNPDLAIKLLSRSGRQNGRATSVKIFFENGDIKNFDWIGECAEWLRANNYTNATVDSIRNNITLSVKKNRKYLGLKFIFDDITC